MKKLLTLILCITSLSGLGSYSVMAAPEWPQGPSIEAESGILMDGNTGAVLYEKNADGTFYPASITKILTALVVIENSDLDDMVTCSKNAIYNVEEKSSNAGLSEGDTLSVRDCLYALMVNSANEAANALAEHVSGTMDDFVILMNQKARELGCTNSNFANPSGLNNENHYTTARDMALISKAAFENPVYREINSATYYKLPPTKQDVEGLKMYAHHKMMLKSQSVYYPGIIGGKTGYTSLAGNTLVTAAEHDGMRLITVILRGTTPAYYTDTSSLLDFGFQNFQNLDMDDYKTQFFTLENDLRLAGLNTEKEPYLIVEDNLVTVPKAAVFEDVKAQLVYEIPRAAPSGTIAGIHYSYSGNNAGTAYLCINPLYQSASDQKARTIASASTPSGSPGTPPISTKAERREATAANASNTGPIAKWTDRLPKFPLPVWIGAGSVLLICALTGGGIALKIHLEKKEAAAQALRRAQRRQRLEASGYSASDFDTLLNQKHSSYTAKRRRFPWFGRRSRR